ncbi:hypothetical protein FXF51_49580 [Nonomuraea sp. PA05]|uniref:hypothetical protein n=1 Tax=Nonomuraea sp. PA05 TaxID=2604466 RepID=UPI0011D3CDFF|nr:hypothetical protein [Nonomuraea sp. PA05]TYB53505.1 hypothetical protein FXF51_49580 [Nonomuraea sp. PA05]
MGAKIVAFVALVLIGAGVLTGFLPLTAGGHACGSAFVEVMPDESLGLLSIDECGDVRSLVRIPAIVLMAAGGATLGGAVLMRWRISLARG